MAEHQTDVAELLGDLEAGVFIQRLTAAITDTALGVVATGKKGDVTITLSLKRISTSNQVECTHTVKYRRPKNNGTVTEDATESTPLYVGVGGKLSLFPESQPDLPGLGKADTTSTSATRA